LTSLINYVSFFKNFESYTDYYDVSYVILPQ